ncbi:hypothetical protein [Alkalimarinus sediminis]|uniref:Uncharacterized protein n=1 Tax=Alkalimarinus sediminis TaxID=1632866 RepID=A0A9E8HIG4_9ALTE|nr:hypothetical protein [Alkalimarinus sediminis]UZW73308.1 hypothetical protein NNL22_09600 [Alkalimarinus sediminis]
MKEVVDHKTALEKIMSDHFSDSRRRVDLVCAEQFFSFKAVTQRHWKNRKDIPQDIAAVPRAGWGLAKKLAGKGQSANRLPSGKEQALLEIVTEELLQLDQLSEKLNCYLEREVESAGLTTQELSSLLDKQNAPVVEAWLKQRIETHAVAQEGVRESLVFIATGLVGRAFSDKAVFGSSMGLGSMAATSLYLSHQGWWSGLMVQIFGVPGWVSVAGMAGGVVATLAIMPVISPLVETGVNRFRAQRMLTKIVDSVEQDMLKESPEIAGIAGRLATFIGLLPDLLQIVVKLRN